MNTTIYGKFLIPGEYLNIQTYRLKSRLTKISWWLNSGPDQSFYFTFCETSSIYKDNLVSLTAFIQTDLKW